MYFHAFINNIKDDDDVEDILLNFISAVASLDIILVSTIIDNNIMNYIDSKEFTASLVTSINTSNRLLLEKLDDIQKSLGKLDKLDDIQKSLGKLDKLDDIKDSLGGKLDNIQGSLGKLDDIKDSLGKLDKLDDIQMFLGKLDDFKCP
jgi:hypothetical protein